MHIIKIRESCIIEAFDGPTAEITPQLIDEMYRPLRENKRRLFEAGLVIEHTLQRIISFYFFGDDECNKARARAFDNLVLTSDWCSFSAKRKLINQIIEETGALKGKAKAEYDKALFDLMSARNAFTHGRISTDGRRIKLAYFQGGPKIQFLDDNYLIAIETTIDACWSTSEAIGFTIGAFRVFNTPNEMPPTDNQQPADVSINQEA